MPSLSRLIVGRSGLALITALSLAACGGTSTQRPDLPAPPVLSNQDPANSLTPPGSEEDFMVNVGRRTYFNQGSATLDDTAKVTLQKQAEWLNRYPNWPVKIQGFADDPGSASDNKSLSKRRADSVREYLISLGVAPDRLGTKGYGRDRLVRDCADISCTSQNRRVITNLQDEPLG